MIVQTLQDILYGRHLELLDREEAQTAQEEFDACVESAEQDNQPGANLDSSEYHIHQSTSQSSGPDLDGMQSEPTGSSLPLQSTATGLHSAQSESHVQRDTSSNDAAQQASCMGASRDEVNVLTPVDVSDVQEPKLDSVVQSTTGGQQK